MGWLRASLRSETNDLLLIVLQVGHHRYRDLVHDSLLFFRGVEKA